MKKNITLLLALLMVLTCFTACLDTPSKNPNGGKQTPKETPAETPENGDQDTPGENEGDTSTQTPPEEVLNIDLENIDYEGSDFHIFHWSTDTGSWSSDHLEFEVTENVSDGDPISDALYRRNLYIEEGLGIKLKFTGETGHDNYQTSFINKLKSLLQNPDTPVDLIAAYSRTAPYVLTNGYAVDLETYSSDLDLTKAWWPSLVREEHEIKGRVFYTSGDASTGLLTQIESLFMNKTLFKGYGYNYDTFMEEVIAGNWTHDQLIEMTKDRFQELDGKPGKTNGDSYGIVGENVCTGDALWTSYGYRLFEISTEEDQVYKLSDDLLGENALNFVNKMTDWTNEPGVYIQYEFAENVLNYSDRCAHFSSGKSLFITMRVGSFDSANVEVDYTILPFPKGDTKQDRYYTCVRDPYSLFSICSQAEDKDMVAQVLQTMGYYGYKLTTPAIFDATFKGQVAKDDYTIKTFDIIRENITFDIGRTFDRITGTMLPNLVSRAWCFQITWTTQFSANKKNIYKNSVELINKELLDLLLIVE